MATQRKKPVDLHKEDLDWVKQKALLKRTEYMEMDGNTQLAVYCKRCGRKIQGLVAHGEPKTFKSGGKIIQQYMMRMSALPLYTEVEIQCDDGSKHVTPCCKECAPFLTEDELDAFLIADTAAEVEESKRSGIPMSEKLLEHRVMRRIKRGDK